MENSVFRDFEEFLTSAAGKPLERRILFIGKSDCRCASEFMSHQWYCKCIILAGYDGDELGNGAILPCRAKCSFLFI